MSTIYTKAVVHESHYHKTFLITHFKTTFLVQLIDGKHVSNPNSKQYQHTTIFLDIAHHRSFKHVAIKNCRSTFLS